MATLISIFNDLRLLQRFCHGEMTKSLSNDSENFRINSGLRF